jgi:NTE family protein
MKKVVNMALQGGGAHGAFTWGVLDQIYEDDRLIIEGFSATSAGSMNAVVASYGYIQNGNSGARALLEEFWYNISTSTEAIRPNKYLPFSDLWKKWNYSVIGKVSSIMSPYQLNPYNYNFIRVILEQLIDFRELSTSSKLYISATNIRTGKQKVFYPEEITVDVVLASACLPQLFQAVKIGEDHYWDGGYLGNPPIFPLFEDSKTQDVIIVHLNPVECQKLPTDAKEISNRISEITFNSSLISELKTIAFHNMLIKEGWLKEEYSDKIKKILVHSIKSDEALLDFDPYSKLDTDWNFLTRLRDLGKEVAKEWLDAHFLQIGQESTVELEKEYLSN